MRSRLRTAAITVTIGLVVGLVVSMVGADVAFTQANAPVFEASLIQADDAGDHVVVGLVIDPGAENPSAVNVVVNFDQSVLAFDSCAATDGLTSCVAEGVSGVRLASTTATAWAQSLTIAEIRFRPVSENETTEVTLSIDRAYLADATPVDGLASPGVLAVELIDQQPDRFCNGKLVTIDMNQNGGDGQGTPGDDVILGTSGNDVIDGKEGSDTICGEGGDDRIDGGVGDFRDFLLGGPGQDTLLGGFGIDYMWGDEGDDTMDGQGGSDRMFGGSGEDTMLGNSGADRMYGGPDKDIMRGMGGQDFMWGEGGPDVMQGNFQSDNMWGGPGDDIIKGAGGKDTLFGGAGNDTLAGGMNTDYLDGGDGVDSVNGGRGRDKPLSPPQVRASNGQFYAGSGCVAETIINCQPTP